MSDVRTLLRAKRRTNAARAQEQERRRKEQELEEEEANRLKRKTPGNEHTVDDLGAAPKKSRVAEEPQPSSSLPPDFFSDPSRAPLASLTDSDDEEDGDAMAGVPLKPTDGDASLDQEWTRFQQSVINPPSATAVYDHATISAEPELVLDPSKGLPTHDDMQSQPVAKVDEEDRRQKAQEERELIMDRLVDEERAQEEAHMRVVVMKNKLEALRKKREAFRSAKSNLGVV